MHIISKMALRLDILAFASHPDDVELSCSGTLMKHIDKGYKIGIVDLTEGSLGSRGTVATRYKEAKKASEIMGITVRENLQFRDGFFEINEAHLLKVITVIRKYQPAIILANAVYDRHPDHKRGGDLVSRANFLSGLIKIETEANGKKQQLWRAKKLFRYIQESYLKPDFAIDISAYAQKKLACIQAFSTQFYNPESTEIETPISTKNYLDYVLSKDKVFGKQINVDYAEGFICEQPSGIEDLFHMQ